MPIKEKDEKLLRALKKKYGDDRGKSIFYAMENSGRLPSQKKKRGKH